MSKLNSGAWIALGTFCLGGSAAFAASVAKSIGINVTQAAPENAPAAPADGASTTSPAPEAAAPPEPAAMSEPVAAGEPGDKVAAAMDARETGRFVGKPITLQVRDADVTDVLRLISDASGFNIVVGDDVKGKLTLSLVDVPWDQALDVVLRTLKLGAERNNNVLRVSSLTELADEKRKEMAAKQAALAAAPLVTKVFPLSYADPKGLADTIVKVTARQSAVAVVSGGGPDAGAVSMAHIQIDARTNSLIVQDVPENIERIKKLIELLDTQTPQVLIEAKVVEASEGFARSLGGNLGIGTATGANQLFASAAGGNPLDALVGSPGVFQDGSAVGKASQGGAAFGLSPSLSFLRGAPRLNAVLSLAESDSLVKVVSSPRMVVLNKQAASVTQSTPVAIPKSTVSNGVVTNSYEIVQANLSLDVIPTVSNDGGVQLDLALTRAVPINAGSGITAVGDRNLKTKVFVESGSTLVIGGVYTMQTNRASTGVPWLRKIPLLGWLFGTDEENTARSELFFFITPRILNTHESGLSG